ncbi:GspH/FimT family pseudopilin [Nitrosomonas sp.]|uniref:GspH/FimT family pseudopilin n=1 Tax=Nitrosomonas sp. TaxID=42353 RepID=UPI0026238B23|nr:GspH/FimT family pseudopilin [Nitrosomonas sp.]
MGFTLIELLVTLSVASILLTMAVPNYRVFVQDSRLITQINGFSSAMTLAKNEAIKRSSPATICPSTNGTDCVGGTVWSNGWIVFSDTDGDGAVDVGEEIIHVGSALSGGNTLTSSGGRTRVTFAASGFSLGFNTTFSLCDSRGISASRALVLSNQGRLRNEVGTGVC